MKLFVMFVMVALLAALCSAQPVDSSVPGQPDTSALDQPETSALDQPDTSRVLRFKRSGIHVGSCEPGYTRRGGFCVPDKDY